jgi:hypothetical protein
MMRKEKFTQAPWYYFIKEASYADGSTKKKCYIEVRGTAMAQFANFGDEVNEANCILAAAAPDMYELLDYLDYYFAFFDEPEIARKIDKVMKKARGEE